jgi:branched-chain amino acid transport system substrate-binding protein
MCAIRRLFAKAVARGKRRCSFTRCCVFAHIAQLKEANVDAIWIAEVGRDAIAFVKQAQEFGLIPKTRLIGHALIQNFMVAATDKSLDGTPGTTGYTPDLDNPRNKAFVAAWKAKFNRLPTDNEGQAYNGTQVLFQGVAKARSVKRPT